MGPETVAFVDKGENQGLRTGQEYEIFRQETRSQGLYVDRDIDYPSQVYGRLLVLRTEPETATVLITEAQRIVSPGARFRGR
jgi:hypothetical protein